jgi:hypothetical protein
VEFDLEDRRGTIESEIRTRLKGGGELPLVVRVVARDALAPADDSDMWRVVSRPGAREAPRSTLLWVSGERCPVAISCDIPGVAVALEGSGADMVEFRLDVRPDLPPGNRYGRLTISNRETGRKIFNRPLSIYVVSPNPQALDNANARGSLDRPSKEGADESQSRIRSMLSALDGNAADPKFPALLETSLLTPEERVLLIRALGSVDSAEARYVLTKLNRQEQLTRAEGEALVAAFRTAAERDPRWALEEYSRSFDQTSRLRVLEALTQGGHPDCFATVKQAYFGESGPVRQQILGFLGRNRSSEAAEFLRQVSLESLDERQACLATGILCSLGTARATEILREISVSGSAARTIALDHLR